MLIIELDSKLQTVTGKEKYEFAGHEGRILFGRSIGPNVGIQLPESLDDLGRRHFELRPAGSSYEVVTDGYHPVYLDGALIVGSRTLELNSEIRLLDAKTGPRIRITVIKDDPGAITRTGALLKPETLQGWMEKLKRRTHQLGWAVAIIAVVVAAVSGRALYQWYHEEQLLAETQALAAQLAERPSESAKADWVDIFERVEKSVYQVAKANNVDKEPAALGTAWVYGPYTLVTNSHVAREYFALDRHEKMVVVAPDGMQTLVKVTGVKLHPAYEDFDQAVLAAAKCIKDPPIEPEFCRTAAIDRLGSYDVAFLTVADDAVLEKPLAVAKEGQADLRAGREIALVGYPAKFAVNKAMQQKQIGHISGSTDFLGIAKDKSGELVYHSAPAAWGASGSPIFDKAGNVIAVFSGGEIQKNSAGDVMISGSATFYAQNALLIADLEKGWSADEASAAQLAWSNAAHYLARKKQIWNVLKEANNTKSLDRNSFPPAFKDDGELPEGGVHIEAKSLKPGLYVASAKALNGEKLVMRVIADGAPMLSPLYIEAMPTAVFTSDGATDVSFVLTGKPGTPYWIHVYQVDGGKDTVLSD